MGKWDLNDLDDRFKEIVKAGKKLVDLLPQDQQDAIHEAERNLREKRDEYVNEAIDWLLDAIIPDSYQGLVKAILTIVLRKVLLDKFAIEVKP